MLKVGLIGVGGISGAHIPVWESMEDVELTALCDIRQERMEPYPEKHHYTELDEMLKNEKLDILDICLPTYLHADYAVRAMKKGIHVLCEKPVSLKSEDVERVYSTAHRMQVSFMVAHVLRFWPEYMLLKELYDTQKYGKLLSGYMSRVSQTPPWSWDNWMKDENRSGLVPFDLHIHDLDFLVYAFGKPEKVNSNRIKRPEQDCINAVYEYPEFYIETESAWYAGAYPFEARYRFQFEKAVVSFENGKCMIYEDNGQITDLTEGATGDTGDINLPKSDAYGNEIRYFTDCVLEKKFPEAVKAEELSAVLEILHNL
ncbi:MAG: Gfo/Idh/MocA family oxidoreductase [Bacillota bacterium]|nr:Gfo/Idh/MocA family oxidoreductase [Bacillota bacterium]